MPAQTKATETDTGTITINGVAYRTIRDNGIFYEPLYATAIQAHGAKHPTIAGYEALGMSLWTKVVWDAV